MSLRWPEVGEVYESRDRRDNDLRVTVIETDYDRGMVRIKRYNRVWVAIHNFRKLYRGPVSNQDTSRGED